MSAIPPKADICSTSACPLWANSGLMQKRSLINHLVGTSEYGRWNCEAQCLGGRKIDDKIEFGRLLGREIVRFRSAQNLIDIFSCTPKQRWIVWSIGQQRASLDKVTRTDDHRQPFAEREGYYLCAIRNNEYVLNNVKCTRLRLDCGKAGRDILRPADGEWRNFET